MERSERSINRQKQQFLTRVSSTEKMISAIQLKDQTAMNRDLIEFTDIKPQNNARNSPNYLIISTKKTYNVQSRLFSYLDRNSPSDQSMTSPKAFTSPKAMPGIKQKMPLAKVDMRLLNYNNKPAFLGQQSSSPHTEFSNRYYADRKHFLSGEIAHRNGQLDSERARNLESKPSHRQNDKKSHKKSYRNRGSPRDSAKSNSSV